MPLMDTLRLILAGCPTMSLRGSGTTEAISQHIENTGIATLLSVARNDGMELSDILFS